MDDRSIESFHVPGVVVVVQARMNARRLPGKALLPLGETTVFEQVISRIEAAQMNAPIVVAIPTGDNERTLRNLCEARELPFVTGSEEDVLSRVLRAAREYEADVVVRCGAHNPFLHPKMLWASARYAVDSGMDYVTVARLPVGVAVEALPVRALQRIAHMTADAEYREQVTTFTNTRPDLFERANLPPPPRLARPDLRLTLETEADYWFLKRLYDEVPSGDDGLLALEDVIAYIDADPELRLHCPDSYAVVRAA